MTINEILSRIKSGKSSARKEIEAAIGRAESIGETNAILEIIRDRALARADEIDAKIAKGENAGKLAGVPFVAKDNFLTLGSKTTAASKMLENFESPIQAAAIEKLEAEGAICIGKANLDAFAHGGSTENSAYGVTENAIDPTRVAGGSSGGSAVVVAKGVVPFALGSDTGGSIRQPASFNGVVGYKPTYGMISRYGVVAMASSTDVVGPIAKMVEDVEIVCEILAGRDGRDGTVLSNYFAKSDDSVEVMYFVHGTTTDNENDRSTGWNDGKLSELGIQQSRDLAKIVENEKFDVVFSSDLARAVESAKLNFPNSEIIQDARLRECNYGDLNGADSGLVREEDHIEIPFPNGESTTDVEKRIRSFSEFLISNYSGKRVAVVAHKSPQLAFQVVAEGKTWTEAIENDWRKTKKWQPGWKYEISNLVKPDNKPSKLKIGLIREFMDENVDPEVREKTLQYVKSLRNAGHEIMEVDLPMAKYSLPIYYIVVPAELSSNLGRYDGIRYGLRAPEARTLGEIYGMSRDQGFVDENKRRIMIGSYVLSSGYFDAYYQQAQKARTLLIDEFNELFANYDLLVGPTAPTPAFKIGENAHDPVKMYLADIMTVPASLAGLPAISVPAGVNDAGLPIGVQIIGPQKSDTLVLNLAKQMEAAK